MGNDHYGCKYFMYMDIHTEKRNRWNTVKSEEHVKTSGEPRMPDDILYANSRLWIVLQHPLQKIIQQLDLFLMQSRGPSSSDGGSSCLPLLSNFALTELLYNLRCTPARSWSGSLFGCPSSSNHSALCSKAAHQGSGSRPRISTICLRMSTSLPKNDSKRAKPRPDFKDRASERPDVRLEAHPPVKPCFRRLVIQRRTWLVGQ